MADGHADRSVAEWRVIWGMIQSNWTPEHAMATFLMPEYAAGEKLRQIHSRSAVAAWSRFDKQWRKAQGLIALNPAKDDPYEVHVAVSDLTAFAEEHSHLWSGQRALDRLAFGYLLGLASTTESLTVRCSSRALAAQLNCRQPTAAKVLLRLTRGPLVSLIRPAQGRSARVYRLVDTHPLQCAVCKSDSVVRTPEGEASTESILHTKVEPVSDVFLPSQPGRRSLGRTPALVWMTMPGHTVTRTDLVTNLGKDRTTIQRALDRLQSAGFIAPAGDGWVKTDADPDIVAEALGIPGIRQRRIDQFQRETDDFQAFLASSARRRYRERRRRHIWHLEQQGVDVPLRDRLPTTRIPPGAALGCGEVGRVTVWFWNNGRYQVRDGTPYDDSKRSR